MKKSIYGTLLILIGFLVCGCGQSKEILIAGETMGTTYNIKVVGGYFTRVSKLKAKIEQRLKSINASMSVYNSGSEISRFNALQDTARKFNVSADIRQVLKTAQKLYDITDGAWDGTVKPLVDLWGFGTQSKKNSLPAAAEIKAGLARVGFRFIQVSTEGISKLKKGITLDLGSIAKGFAVDQIANLLKAERFKDFLIEIGGETYAAGHRRDGRLWKVGINTPRSDAVYDAIYKVVALKNQALATSGDYRNFFEIDGKRYAHILDPRTGHPISNGVVSVSVIADCCIFADGLATAIMVMEPAKGRQLLNRLDQVEGLIIATGSDGNLIDYESKGFHRSTAPL